MDTDKQMVRFYMVHMLVIAIVKNAAGSIGHGPGLLPVPVVVGWTKYVPQNVPPHAWTTTYFNTGLKVLPPPPYYAPTFPYPIAPVTPPIYPFPRAVAPVAPVAPILPPPTFNSNPPLFPAPTFNTNVPVFPPSTFNGKTPVFPPPTFNGNTPVFRGPLPVPFPKPEGPSQFPVGPPQFPSGPIPQPSAGADSDNGLPPTGNFFPSNGFPASGNLLSPLVAYPGKFGGPPSQPLVSPGRGPRPSYSVTEGREPEYTYGPPPSPFSGKYRSAPLETYGPPPSHGKGEPLIREYPSHSPGSHVVRVVTRPYSRYSQSEFLR